MAELKQIVDMERVLSYIMAHLEEELSISQVADYFQYNDEYYCLKKPSFRQYGNRYSRAETAIDWLDYNS